MITGAVVDENRYSYSLNNLGRDYLEERKNEKLLRAAAAEWGIDPEGRDVEASAQVCRALRRAGRGHDPALVGTFEG
jgi:hypothetical protein